MPAPEMQPVYSSQVNAMGYDQETGDLYVTFKNDRTAVYSDVPADVASAVMNATSVGLALNNMIKDVYTFRYAN